MPGTHEDLKSEIMGMFLHGATPSQILKAYPQVPRRTVYRWHKVAQETMSVALESHSRKITAHTPSGVSSSAIVTVIDGYGEQSDIGLSRQTLRSICKDKSVPPSTRVQAALGLMKLAYLRSELPKHIIDETTTIDLDAHKQDIAELDDNELQRRIREKMG